MKRAILATLAALALVFLLLVEVIPYGSDHTTNSGILLRVKIAPVCAGFEMRGNVGFFGGRYSDCDI